MYKIYCDGYLLHDDGLENLRVLSPKFNGELNKTGTFTFQIRPEHPYYALIKRMKSIITVMQEGYMLFRGRVLNDSLGFRNEKNVECEGDLSFLIDSIVRPYEYSGSVSGFVEMLINNHNSQVQEDHRFTLGNVTVTDPNDYITRSSTGYDSTWDVANDKLLKNLGGYLWTRHENGVNYLDYISDFSLLSSQTIEFGKNLVDLTKERRGEEIITALIPVGADGLTIESVNNGVDYVYNAEAVERYGWIFRTNEWSDVTVASNLKTKAQAYVDSNALETQTIELSAADLSGIGYNVSAFHLGTYVKVKTEPHGINDNFLVNKISIDLMNPANNTLQLGVTSKTISDYTNEMRKDAFQKIEDVSKEQTESVKQLERTFSSSLESTESNIMTSVAENYYLKGETDQLVSSLSSSLEQTASGFTMKFEQFNTDLTNVADNADARFTEISKYIRFIDGNIVLGEAGSEITLKIENDKIVFLQNNSEVAYFTDNRLYVTDAEFTNSLQLGNFAFFPRSNGNLSFKKIQ